MKTYHVDLVSRVTVPILAESPIDAVNLAKNIHKSYSVDALSTDDGLQICVLVCENCEKEFLDTENYSVSEEDGYCVCESCTKEAMS